MSILENWVRKSASVIVGAALICSLAACSTVTGSGADAEPVAPQDEQVAVAEQPEQPEQPSHTPTPVGGRTVVMAACTPTSVELLEYTVETRGLAESPVPMECAEMLNASPDGTRFAFAFTDSADNSAHVGWYEDGTRVDITSMLKEAASAMSPVRQDVSPMFTWDNDFAFRDTLTNMIITIDTETREVIREQEPASNSDSFTINPDGTANRGNNGTGDFPFAFEIPGDPGSRFCPRWRDYVSFFPGDGTAVLSSLTVVRDTGVKSGSGCNETEILRTLLPDTDFNIASRTYDPESGLAYFVGGRGAEAYLFTVPIDGTGEVEQVADLSSYVLGAWVPVVIGFHE